MLKKYFLYFLITALLVVHSPVSNGHFYNEEGWAAAGRYMKEAIDPSADPCEDFYRYACGKWDHKYNGTYKNEVDKALEDAIQYLIKAIRGIRDTPETPTYQKRLQAFYKQCIDATEDEEVILKEIYNQIQKVIGPMPLVSGQRSIGNVTNPYKLMGHMQQLFNTSVLVFASVEREADGCHFRPILTLHPAQLKQSHKVREDSSLTQKLLTMANRQQNGNITRFTNQLKKLIALEKDLTTLLEMSNASWATYEVSKTARTLNKVNSSDWSWLDYFQGLLPDRAFEIWQLPTTVSKGKLRHTRVTFRHASYFHGLDNLIQTYGAETMLDYAYWRAIRNYLEYFLDTPQYHKKNTTFASIDRQCLDYVFQYASAAAARLLFDSYGSNAFDWKYDVELVGQAVASAFRYMIYNADWLDLEDKIVIMNKLKLISVDSGIPEWLLNDTAVEEHTPPFDPQRSTFENDLLMFRDKFVWKMQPLWRNESETISPGVNTGTKADILVDPEPNFIPFAQYSEQRIEVWLGAILPPLYNYSYPLGLKFSALGAVVGEQLMRAFDPDEINERIGIRKLLKPEAVLLYRLRRECVALTQPFFRRCMTHPADKSEDCLRISQLLLGLTADSEGMKLAYMAYAFMTQTVGREPRLPGLSDYNADQLFFLGYARFLCGVREQVEIALSNFPAFGKAWNCKAGSRFAPEAKCTLWSNSSSNKPVGRRRKE